jgi:hypothetical protein
MPDYRRTGYAPWSLTREAGVESATVDGTIQVDQYLQPTIDTGFVDEKGNWQGRKSGDRDFVGFTNALGIPNGGDALFPDTNNFPNINMAGFTNIFIAIKTTRSGNVAIRAVMGPDTQPFANLRPVDAAASLRVFKNLASGSADLADGVVDSSESLTADVWNIFYIPERCENQRNMQFQITNNAGGEANLEFSFMRLV